MPISSWLSGNNAASQTKHVSEATSSTSPSDLASRIQQDHARLSELRNLCESQDKCLQNLRFEIKKIREQVSREKKINEALEKKKNNHQTTISHFQDIVSKRNREIQQVNHDILGLKATSLQLSTAFRDAKHQIAELKFENELLKCTVVPSETSQHGSKLTSGIESRLLPLPFVVVLVDGDAYHWKSDHFVNPHTTPGGHAAQCIKEEVQEYLLKHPQIPLQSKIVIRVICNARSLGKTSGNVTTRRKSTSERHLENFMTQFSESMPLFDFYDAGHGKERADEKIKGQSPRDSRLECLINLANRRTREFPSVHHNPCCWRIFFAGCTDNGFARLLEQYSNNPLAREKIVLVHPGYVEKEIGRLNLTSIEWTNVFARMVLPPPSQAKIDRDQSRLDAHNVTKKREQEEGELKLGKAQYAKLLLEKAVATGVMESCELMDINTLFGASTGVRAFHQRARPGLQRDLKLADASLPYWDMGVD